MAGQVRAGLFLFLAFMVFLLIFTGRRYRIRQGEPPPFVLMATGMIVGDSLFGVLYALVVESAASRRMAWRNGLSPRGLAFIGLVALIDPPRPEAITAVDACHSASIIVKMITGDSPMTAASIGKQIGIETPFVLTGGEIDNMDEATLDSKVIPCNIYARVTPEHKLRIVRALQADGGIVAMTGDGVNDAPALAQADLGVAIGAIGLDAGADINGQRGATRAYLHNAIGHVCRRESTRQNEMRGYAWWKE